MPSASPAVIAAVVSAMPSGTVAAPRRSSAPLRSRLDEFEVAQDEALQAPQIESIDEVVKAGSEERLSKPSASPALFAAVVSAMPLDTVAASRSLSAPLRPRPDEFEEVVVAPQIETTDEVLRAGLEEQLSKARHRKMNDATNTLEDMHEDRALPVDTKGDVTDVVDSGLTGNFKEAGGKAGDPISDAILTKGEEFTEVGGPSPLDKTKGSRRADASLKGEQFAATQAEVRGQRRLRDGQRQRRGRLAHADYEGPALPGRRAAAMTKTAAAKPKAVPALTWDHTQAWPSEEEWLDFLAWNDVVAEVLSIYNSEMAVGHLRTAMRGFSHEGFGRIILAALAG